MFIVLCLDSSDVHKRMLETSSYGILPSSRMWNRAFSWITTSSGGTCVDFQITKVYPKHRYIWTALHRITVQNSTQGYYQASSMRLVVLWRRYLAKCNLNICQCSDNVAVSSASHPVQLSMRSNETPGSSGNLSSSYHGFLKILSNTRKNSYNVFFFKSATDSSIYVWITGCGLLLIL